MVLSDCSKIEQSLNSRLLETKGGPMSRKEEMLSRRERRALARRRQIVDGAAQVFAEKGYHAATTREIAQAADVSEGSIYHYFDSKKDLLLAIMDRLRLSQPPSSSSAPDDAGQMPPVDPRDVLKIVIRDRQAFAMEQQPMLRAVMSEILIDEAFAERYYGELLALSIEMMERYLQALIDQGRITDVDTALFTRFFVAANLGLAELLFLGDPLLEAKWGSDELIEALTDFFLIGLASPVEGQESKV
jgi:AcrR family transcriptional regulator